MGFDASKLVVGKWYPTRGGKRKKYLARINHPKYMLVFAYENGVGDSEAVSTHAVDGRYAADGYGESDIISDEPIKEPVEVTNHRRFLFVCGDGSMIPCRTKEEAREYVDTYLVGIYELPEKILVQPK